MHDSKTNFSWVILFLFQFKQLFQGGDDDLTYELEKQVLIY